MAEFMCNAYFCVAFWYIYIHSLGGVFLDHITTLQKLQLHV